MKKRTITRIITFLLALSIMLALAACGAAQAQAPARQVDSSHQERPGSESTSNAKDESPLEDFKYSYDADTEGISIDKYIGTSIHIIIPAEIDGEPVTCIGSYAFQKCTAKDVVIPDTVVEIGTSAFERSDIVQINIPDGIQKFGDYVFEWHSSELEISYLGQTGDEQAFHDLLLKTTGIDYKMYHLY